MKSSIIILIVVLINVAFCLEACPEGEYYPGPQCNDKNVREPEPICPPKSAHHMPSFNCCWCNAGTFRQISSGKCVKFEDCYKY